MRRFRVYVDGFILEDRYISLWEVEVVELLGLITCERVVCRHRAILLILRVHGIYYSAGSDHTGDDEQKREGEELGQDVEAFEREEEFKWVERQRTVRHVMSCGWALFFTKTRATTPWAMQVHVRTGWVYKCVEKIRVWGCSVHTQCICRPELLSFPWHDWHPSLTTVVYRAWGKRQLRTTGESQRTDHPARTLVFLWEIGDPRNRNSAVNLRSVLRIVGQQAWVCRRGWPWDWRGRWERTCAGGQCQVRQGTRHDAWMTECFWHTNP